MAVVQSLKIGFLKNYYSKKISIILEKVPWASWIWTLQHCQANFAGKQKSFHEIRKAMKKWKCFEKILFEKFLWTPRLRFEKPAENRSPKIYTCCSKYGKRSKKISFSIKNKFSSKFFLRSGKIGFLNPAKQLFALWRTLKASTFPSNINSPKVQWQLLKVRKKALEKFTSPKKWAISSKKSLVQVECEFYNIAGEISSENKICSTRSQSRWNLKVLRIKLSQKNSSGHTDCDLTNLPRNVSQNLYMLLKVRKMLQKRSLFSKRTCFSAKSFSGHIKIGFINPTKELFTLRQKCKIACSRPGKMW